MDLKSWISCWLDPSLLVVRLPAILTRTMHVEDGMQDMMKLNLIRKLRLSWTVYLG